MHLLLIIGAILELILVLDEAAAAFAYAAASSFEASGSTAFAATAIKDDATSAAHG